MKSSKSFFRKVDKKQCIEFGQLCALLMLVLFFNSNQKIFISIALIILVANMIVPVIFYPIAVLWFTIAEKLSEAGSVIILSIIFFVIVLPVGFLRKLSGKDNLKLKQFRQGKSSVMISREHVYSKEDLQHSF